MGKNVMPFIQCFILLSTTGLIIFLNTTLLSSGIAQNASPEYSWIVHGFFNALGYSAILVPGYLVYTFVTKTNYLLDKGSSGCFTKLLEKCFGEEELLLHNQNLSSNSIPRTPIQDVLLLMFYFLGLQASFLSWGILQEKIMTKEYVNDHNEKAFFKDSQFLVFVNRILAFFMSGIVLVCTRQPKHKCPLYKYSYCSLSNILSSWCQYEALKYVSFPHQVLAKAAKTIPVMLMGKIVSKNKYEYYEYVTAVVLSLGMLLFMLDAGNDRSDSPATTLSGVFLLCCYLVFDSFTSNWQGGLFQQYSMTPVQMMCCVNFFSCLFTAASLLQQNGFTHSLSFMLQFPSFILDCILLSVCSATGQLFIFRTVATFGPLVFTIITTIRLGLSVLLSCIIYNHHVGFVGSFGMILVFLSISLRIYCSYRIKLKTKGAAVN